MITACHNCEFNGKGLLLEELLPAGKVTDKDALKAKDALLRYFSDRCINCKRVDHDDIRIEKTPHNVRPDLTQADEPRPSEQATPLPSEAEDVMRRMLMTVTGLDPLDVLLLLHVAKGGTPSTFGRFVNHLVEVARLYGPCISRMTARAKWLAICKTFAPFAKLRQWAYGHAARDAAQGDAEEPELTQGELDLWAVSQNAEKRP